MNTILVNIACLCHSNDEMTNTNHSTVPSIVPVNPLIKLRITTLGQMGQGLAHLNTLC